MRFRIDPEFRNLCPPLAKDEYAGLRESIKEHDGLLSQLIAWGNPDDGDPTPILLDGHNRTGIMTVLGMETPPPHLLKFTSRAEAAQWIIKNQTSRRNLSESQRAMMAAKLETLKRGTTKADMPNGISRTEAAETANVSPRSVARAAKVLKDGAPELVNAVESGEIKVSTAARVAEVLPPEQQTAVMVLPPEEREETISGIVHGPAEVSHAIAQALTDNNGFKVIQAAVIVAGAELNKAFTEKWIKTLDKNAKKQAVKLLNALMNEIENMQEKLK